MCKKYDAALKYIEECVLSLGKLDKGLRHEQDNLFFQIFSTIMYDYQALHESLLKCESQIFALSIEEPAMILEKYGDERANDMVEEFEICKEGLLDRSEILHKIAWNLQLQANRIRGYHIEKYNKDYDLLREVESNYRDHWYFLNDYLKAISDKATFDAISDVVDSIKSSSNNNDICEQ